MAGGCIKCTKLGRVRRELADGRELCVQCMTRELANLHTDELEMEFRIQEPEKVGTFEPVAAPAARVFNKRLQRAAGG